MTIKDCILGIFAFLPIALSSQTITVSEEIPLRNAVSYELIGKLNNNILLLQDRTTEVEVFGFNPSLKQEWTKELELDKRQPKLLGVISGKDYFNVIYKFRERGKTVIKVHKYDAGANLIDSATVKNYGSLLFTPEFEIINSDDRSKFCIYYLEKLKVIQAVSFDLNTMKVLWDKSISPDDMDYSYEFVQTTLSNNGDFALVLNKDNFRSKRKENHYEVHEFNTVRNTWNLTKVNLGDYLTFDVLFEYDNLNGGLVAGGLYSDKNLARSNGYFYVSIPEDIKSSYIIKFQEFNEEFITNLLGKEIDKNRGIIETTVEDLVLRRDGGILLIAERNREVERRSYGYSGARTAYNPSRLFLVDYYNDDMFVISIHPNGETHWQTVLAKKQFSQDDGGIYSSFFLFKTPSNLRFLFNDEIKNANTVSEYVLRGDGSFDRNSLLNTQNLDLKLRFRDAVQISTTELLVPSERNNRIKLVIFKYTF